MSKQRLDKLLVSRGLAETRHQAQAVILAGQVYVNNQRVDKAGRNIEQDAAIELKSRGSAYVSRGGVKLEGALETFALSVAGAVCLDVGASTGGFTDCLLQHGAVSVYALDVGRGQLHWRLRLDPRVVVFEGVNARYLKPADIPRRFNLVTVDVSFISLTKVLPALVPVLDAGGSILALVKPQFEVGRGEVGRKGVVRDPQKHRQVLETLQSFVQKRLQLGLVGIAESSLVGPKGNREFFMLLRKQPEVAGHEVGSIPHGS